MADFLTAEQFYRYYSTERQVLRKLVGECHIEPIRAILTVAFWFWLEHCYACRNLFPQISRLEINHLQALCNEAYVCLLCLEYSDADDFASFRAVLPHTVNLIHKDVHLAMLNYWRFTVFGRIKNILNDVCSLAFTDILSNVYGIQDPTNLAGRPTPIILPGFPHRVYGPFRPSQRQWNLRDDNLWNPSNDVDALFLTSAAPFREGDVRCLFSTLVHGSCVLEIRMGDMWREEPCVREEALYATVVVDYVATVDRVLQGRIQRYYNVNMKDLWVRRYEHPE